jgi:hypothetical protein
LWLKRLKIPFRTRRNEEWKKNRLNKMKIQWRKKNRMNKFYKNWVIISHQHQHHKQHTHTHFHPHEYFHNQYTHQVTQSAVWQKYSHVVVFFWRTKNRLEATTKKTSSQTVCDFCFQSLYISSIVLKSYTYNILFFYLK